MASGRVGSRPVCRSAAARLGWPARRSAPTARLRRLAITPGEAAGARSGGVFAEFHVADPVQPVLDPPVPAQAQPANWAGLAVPSARLVTAYTGDGAPAAAARRADAAGDLDRLGGVREAQAGDGGDLQGPDLNAAVALVAGAVHPPGSAATGNSASWACRVGWLALTTSR